MRLIDADALADALFEKRKNYPEAAAWKFVNRWHSICEDWDGKIDQVQKTNDAFQKKLFNGQAKFEKSLRKYYNTQTMKVTDTTGLQEALNNYTAEIYKEYFKLF